MRLNGSQHAISPIVLAWTPPAIPAWTRMEIRFQMRTGAGAPPHRARHSSFAAGAGARAADHGSGWGVPDVRREERAPACVMVDVCTVDGRAGHVGSLAGRGFGVAGIECRGEDRVRSLEMMQEEGGPAAAPSIHQFCFGWSGDCGSSDGDDGS